MLSSEEKKFLVIRAEKYYDGKLGKTDSDTQIQRFSSIAQQSSCYEEFMNFLKYQTGRARARNKGKDFQKGLIDFRKGLIEEIKAIKEKVGYEKSLEAIASYFGYMARYAKFRR